MFFTLCCFTGCIYIILCFFFSFLLSIFEDVFVRRIFHVLLPLTHVQIINFIIYYKVYLFYFKDGRGFRTLIPPKRLNLASIVENKVWHFKGKYLPLFQLWEKSLVNNFVNLKKSRKFTLNRLPRPCTYLSTDPFVME